MYLPIMVVCILLGALVRLSFISKGADSFTANIFFMAVIFTGLVVYAGLNLLLHTVYDVIKRIILRRRLPVLVNEPISFSPVISDLQEELKAKKEIIINDRLNVALKYTQEQFALYTSEPDLKSLCEYVTAYSKNEKIENVKAVVVHTLSKTDLYHFGWNIWKHFDRRNQIEVARFLKSIFKISLKDVEEDSIKSHLRDDEKKGIIKIEKNITA
ncbi:mobilization protein [Chryseobacterium artocarpi]|nr:mobilization protein [Chryseobacterium artocarpi]